MGCFGQCGCPCCLTGAEIPFGAVVLKTPYQNCDESEEEPDYPQFGINPSQEGCCFEGRFILFCPEQPVSESCSLWAKRTTNHSFTVNYYQKENSFRTTTDLEPEGCCECTLVQSVSTDSTSTARRFFGSSRQLNAIKITIGKTLIQCEGDEVPTCKYFIAATYEFIVREGMSAQVDYSQSTQVCTGVFRPGDCSVSASSSTEFGEDTDTCPEDAIQYTEESTVEITRAKFFDELPTGEIEITADDDTPFSCCDGKTNCDVSQIPCDLAIGNTNCFGNVPLYDEAEYGYLSVCNLFLDGGPLWLDEETGELRCYEVQANGMYEQGPFTSGCFVRAVASGCYVAGPPCEGIFLGVDRFVKDAYDYTNYPLGNELEGSSMCNGLDVDYVNPGNVAGPDCDGETGGLCVVPDCCVSSTEGGFSIETPCNYLGLFCGRKITDYDCDHLRTDYPTGAFCLSLPTVTLELV